MTPRRKTRAWKKGWFTAGEVSAREMESRERVTHRDRPWWSTRTGLRRRGEDGSG
jgi:uncharacterized phage-associated protein